MESPLASPRHTDAHEHAENVPVNLDNFRSATLEWKLSNDVELMGYLRSFSEALVKRTKDLEQQVETLLFDGKSVDVKLHNTFNRFLMLSNNQFIENRVWEADDPTVKAEAAEAKPAESAPDAAEPTREQYEAQLVPKYSEAVQYAVALLNKTAPQAAAVAAAPKPTDDEAAEQDVPSDEDDDPFAEDFDDRPLPFIIGTKAFEDDDNCGLYIESDDESEAAPEQDADGHVAPIGPADESDLFSSESESETESWTSSTDAESVSSEGGMFGESDSDEVESPHAQPEPQRVPVIPVPKQAAVEPASDQDAQQPAGEDDDDEGWDDDEPKKPEVPAAPMDIKAQLNAMFSRGFIPQAPKQTAPADDEEGQPEQAPQASAAPEEGKRHRRHRKGEREKDGKSRHRHHHHRKGRDAEAQPQTAQQKQQALFGAEDEDGDIFARDNKFSSQPSNFASEIAGIENSLKAPAPTTTDVYSTKPVTSGGLFDFDAGDMFGPSKSPEPVAPVKPAVVPKTSNLFGESDDEAPKPTKVEPVIIKPIGQKPSSKKSASLFDDEDEEESAPAPVPVKAVPVFPVTQKSAAPKASNLFGDDSDEESAPAPVKPVTATGEKPKSSGLFGDASDPVTSAAPKASSLFGDDSDSEQKTAPAKPVPVIIKPITQKPVAAKGSSLFGDSDDESTPVTKPVQQPQKPATGLFGDDDEKPKPVPVVVAAQKQKLGSAPLKSGGLFDDEDDDAPSAIIAAPVKPVQQQKPAPATRVGSGLFDDDDDPLAVSTKPVQVAPAAIAPAVTQSPSKPAVPKTGGLFDDEDDPLAAIPKTGPKSDLFGAESPPAPAVVPPAASLARGLLSDAPKPTVATPAAQPTTTVKAASSLFDDEPPKPSSPAKPVVKSTPKSSLFGDDDPLGGVQAPAVKPAPAPASDPLGSQAEPKPMGVAALRAGLKLNAAMFMPGARPPPKQAAPLVFDDDSTPPAPVSTGAKAISAPPPAQQPSDDSSLGDVRATRSRGPARRPPTKLASSTEPLPVPAAQPAAPTSTTVGPARAPAPTSAPTSAPISAPVATPTSAPVAAPVIAPAPQAPASVAVKLPAKKQVDIDDLFADVIAGPKRGSPKPSTPSKATPSPTAAAAKKPAAKKPVNVDDLFADVVPVTTKKASAKKPVANIFDD